MQATMKWDQCAKGQVWRSICRMCGERAPTVQKAPLPYWQGKLTQHQRQYARPARLTIPPEVAFKPPPAPPKPPPPTVEDGHVPGEPEEAVGPFDSFLASIAQSMKSEGATSVLALHAQYHERGGRMCRFVIPYEERPAQHRRADTYPDNASEVGDGLVMVVHAYLKMNGELDKICACSGFVVDAQGGGDKEGEVVITCAHTPDEMYRNIKRAKDNGSRPSLSVVIPSQGRPRRIQQILSSMPRSDTVAMQLEPDVGTTTRLRALPLSPFPLQTGSTLLTHLFGAPDSPVVTRSRSRLPSSTKEHSDVTRIETSFRWLNDQAWRRWGAGVMLGYRSYTNIEVEAGIHSSLPHILTSILPTPGSSGGPLVCAETGAVVGMISGTRMDNRVEGERGWGASSESIFEMFSLPGFTPTGGT